MKPAIQKVYGEIKTNELLRDALGTIHCYFLNKEDVG